MVKISRLAALAAFSVVAFVVVRDAIVRSNLPDHARQAVAAWPDHPAVVIADRMFAIGEAARRHHPVGDDLTRPIIETVRRSPLSIEPFLVAGVKAQAAGDEETAGELFRAAADRDPRAAVPHLFLSAHWNKMGQGTLSLTELGKLVHLVPGAAGQLAPKIALSVQQAGGLPKVRALVAQNPELRDDVMRAMSTNARNLGFVLNLSTPTSSNDWQPVMIQSLIVAGEFDRAFELWRQANRVDGSPLRRQLLFDPGFRTSLAPPFGWTLTNGVSGIAEPAEGGGLHLVAYRREAFVAASQTLILAPGTYRLEQKVSVTTGNISGLDWRLTCLVSEGKIGSVVGSAVVLAGDFEGMFDVPAGCAAQRIELNIAEADMPETLDVTFGSIALSKIR